MENSWIRDVTVQHFSHGFNLNVGSRFNTVQNVAYIDANFRITGGNHYGFNMNKGQQNLIQRCYGRNGRHTLVTGSRVRGPNVFLDCYIHQIQADDGPHHRWATGILYDNTKTWLWRTQNRTDAGTGHGWAGAQQLLWNAHNAEIVLQAPQAAMNWSIGTTGTIIKGNKVPDAPDGIFESHGTMVEPRSLYLQQLKERLGDGAVEAVTTSAQRSGRIWTQLGTWQGEGEFE